MMDHRHHRYFCLRKRFGSRTRRKPSYAQRAVETMVQCHELSFGILSYKFTTASKLWKRKITTYYAAALSSCGPKTSLLAHFMTFYSNHEDRFYGLRWRTNKWPPTVLKSIGDWSPKKLKKNIHIYPCMNFISVTSWQQLWCSALKRVFYNMKQTCDCLEFSRQKTYFHWKC